jgi:hypothetical protein
LAEPVAAPDDPDELVPLDEPDPPPATPGSGVGVQVVSGWHEGVVGHGVFAGQLGTEQMAVVVVAQAHATPGLACGAAVPGLTVSAGPPGFT